MWDSQLLIGPRGEKPSMLMGLVIRIAGVAALGVEAPLPASEAGEGNSAFAVKVGESGVGKPGYFLPTSVKRDNVGLIASGWGRAFWKLPMPNTGTLPGGCTAPTKLLIDPSREAANEGRRLCTSLWMCASVAGKRWNVVLVNRLVGLVLLLLLVGEPSLVMRRRAWAIRALTGSARAKRASSQIQRPPYCCQGKFRRKLSSG